MILFFSITHMHVYGQDTADSLRQLVKKSDALRKGELNLELATYFMGQNPDSAIAYARDAIEVGNVVKSNTIIIRAYAKIAEAYQNQNRMKDAIANYLKGLQLAEKAGEKSLQGTIYNGMGTCYFYQNDLKKAEKYFHLAAQAKKEANDYKYYSFISINLSTLQITGRSYKQAVQTLRDAEKTLIQNNQEQYLSTVYNTLGAAYQAIKPDSCLYYYQKSDGLAVKYGDLLNQMTANQNIGDYYLEKKNYALAADYMKKAIAVNDKRPEDHFKPALYDRISLVYEELGDFKEAYRYKKLEVEANKRITSVQQQKESQELEVKYQTEKKEKQIELNRQEIERGKNQRNLILLGAVSVLVITAFFIYLVLQRKKIKQQFELEKLKMFENILHEIRTPLTLIKGPIEVLKQQVKNPHKEQVRLLERNSRKLMQLVNELLDASKVGKGNFNIEYTTGSISVFIDNIASTFTAEGETKNITLATEHNNTGNYSFPANALEKILSNLITNAIKYCPPQSKIWVRSYLTADILTIEVEDNGPGIPDTEKKKVFQRFFRGRHSAGTNGTGIGLSMVKELAELSKGTIQFKSSPSGTVFTVSVPVQKNEVINVAERGFNNELPTLILAEDDPDIAAFTLSLLKPDFNVIHATNGQEAINLIKKELPELVLSDIVMPLKDGIELLKEIRSDELTSHLPVILLSAKDSLENRLEGLTHGADAYISKPFSPEELKLTAGNLFTTIRRSRENYQLGISSSKPFDERIKSDNPYVNKIISCIISNIDNHDYSVNELAADMAVSRSQLHRKLDTLTGFSTTNFIRMVRLEKAKDMLLASEGNISEIADKCGFSSQSYFTKSFSDYFGKSPSQYLKN